MTETSIATSADYADALLVARRGKHLLFLLLLLMLLLQITFFFIARYTDVIVVAPVAAAVATPVEGAPPAEAAAIATTHPASAPISARYIAFSWFTGLITFLGTVLPILLALVLLLIVNVMLVGRLLGLARLTSAFLWALVLMLLLFPWQHFFGGTPQAADFRLPGVLYTWNDLVLNAKFPVDDARVAIIKWARFVGWPLIAVIVLMIVQIKSNRGLRQALGEAQPDYEREV